MSDFIVSPEYRIAYPPGVLTRSCRGNGTVNTRGLDISLEGDRILIVPVNSQRTAASSCLVELPADKTVLKAVISRLREIAMMLENST